MDSLTSTDLCVPIYLNQQVVFDLLALLENGFSQISTMKTSTGESEDSRSGVGASIGASNVFALLGVSFSADRARQKTSQEQTEVSQEKVHTPTSLFGRLRLQLTERGLLRGLTSAAGLDQLTGGEFVEYRAILRKNPLVDALEAFRQLMELASVFTTTGDTTKSAKQKSGQNKSEIGVILKQIDGMLSGLVQGNSVEIIGELLDAPPVRSVLTARLDFFSQGGTSEIIDGEFRVVGKTIRVLRSAEEQPINLLRKTTFGHLNEDMITKLAQAFEGMGPAGFRIPEFVTEIRGPAIQVVPIAIFA